VGKLYNQDQGAAVFDILQRLRQESFGTGRSLVPEPVAYDPVSRFLILTWSEGELLRSLLLARADVPTDSGGGRMAARFHASSVTSGRCYTFSRHLPTLAFWKQRVAAVYPQAAGRLTDLLHRMKTVARRCRPGRRARPIAIFHRIIWSLRAIR